MLAGLLGKKIGMTQMYNRQGDLRPVTVLQVGPCHVLQVKNHDRDGYWAVQLGFQDKKRKRATKPELGRARALDLEPKKFVKEIRVEGDPGIEPGQEVTVEVFEGASLVNVTGTSKGKGFAGGMKRWGFKGGPASHGAHKVHRSPGSIGASSDPSRVFKGTHMAGHMGMCRCTVKNLRVVKVDKERNLLAVEGAVPGPTGGYVEVQRVNSSKGEKE